MGRGRVGCCFFFSSRRRHTRCSRDWSSDVCSSDLDQSVGWSFVFLDSASPSASTISTCPDRVAQFIKSNASLNKLTDINAVSALRIACSSESRNCVDIGQFVDRKSTRLNSSHGYISYAVFCLKKKKKTKNKKNTTKKK